MSPPQPQTNRLGAVDGIRGFAVVAMIVWHTSDSWLRPVLRSTGLFTLLRMIGGTAAPLFFLLAGFGVAMAMSSGRTDLKTLVVRGMRITLGGYALSYAQWMFDRNTWRSIPVLALAYGLSLLLVSWGIELEPFSKGPFKKWSLQKPAKWRRSLGYLSIALGLIVAFVCVQFVSPSTRRVWLKRDVLHGLGVGIALTALLVWLQSDRSASAGKVTFEPSRKKLWLNGILSLCLLLSVRSFVGVPHTFLPDFIADWFVRDATLPSRREGFPISPFVWIAFAGVALACAPTLLRSRAALVVGVLLIIFAPDTSPLNLWLSHYRWLASLRYAGLYFGVALVVGGILTRIEPLRFAKWPSAWLRSLGNNSLWIYCIHLEFAFGRFANTFRRSLSVPAWAAGTTLLILAMLLLSFGLDARTKRMRQKTTAQPT